MSNSSVTSARYPLIEYMLMCMLMGLMVYAATSALGMNFVDTLKAIATSLIDDLSAVASGIRNAM